MSSTPSASPFDEDPSPAESDSPAESAPSPRIGAADRPDDTRGTHRLGLVGLPNSGKTSWLYALVHGHRNYSIVNGGGEHVQGQRQWYMGAVETGFAEIIGRPGDQQEGTRAEFFKRRRFCQMRRPWMPWFPSRWLSSTFWLSIPEVSGETVKGIADGQIPPNADARRSAEEYLQFLADCDEIVCLAGLDGERGGDSGLRIDAALTRPISAFERVLGQAIKQRGKRKRPIAVTVLITKVDLLKSDPALDELSIERDKSDLHAIAVATKDESLLTRLGGDSDCIRVRVTSLVQSDVARGNLGIQAAIAADFIRRHAPTAAKALARLREIEGLDVRFFLCAPYGSRPIMKGQEVHPQPDMMKPMMVYEPLEEVLERGWRWKAGSRLRRNMFIAALVLLTIGLLGPGILEWRERSFDAKVRAAAPWLELQESLESIESHPLFAAECSLSDSTRSEHARRLLDVRNSMQQALTPDQERDWGKYEERALEFDPDATIKFEGQIIRLEDHVAERDRRWLQEFLDGTRTLETRTLTLGPAGIARFVRFVDTCVARPRSAADWEKLAVRIEQVAIEGDRPDRKVHIRVRNDGDVVQSVLGRLLAAAKTRVAIEAPDEMAVLTIEGATLLLRSAAQAGDQEGLRRIDARLLKRVDDQWNKELAASESGDPDPRLLAFLRDASLEVAWLAPRKHARAESAFNSWIGSFDDRVREFLSPEQDAPIDRGLADAVAYVQSVRQSLEALEERYPAIAAKAARNLKPVFRSLADRQEYLMRLRRTPGFDDSAAASLQAEFAPVSWQSMSDLGLEPAVFETLARRQEKQLEQMLQSRFDVARKAKDLEQAERILAAIVVARGGKADVGALENLLALARDVGLEQIDEPSFRERLKAALSDSGNVPEVVVLIAGATDFPQVVSAATDVIASVPMPAEKRRQLAKSLLDRVEIRRWRELPPDRIVAVLDAFRRGGLEPVDTARTMLAGILQEVIDEREAPLRKPLLEQVRAVLRSVSTMVPGDRTPDLLKPVIDRLARAFRDADTAEDLAESGEVERIRTILAGAVGTEGVSSPAIDRIVQDSKAHMERIRDWKLVRIPGQDFWIARLEWTKDDVREVATRWTADWENLLLEHRESIPYNSEGKVKTAPLPDEPPQNLRIKDLEVAKDLVAIVGLRLPTVAEFGVMSNDFKGRPPIWNKPKSPFDCSEPALRALGDVTDSGIVGARFGVREWTSNGARPLGASNQNPDRTEPFLATEWDVGLRPALDGLPESLAQRITPK